MALRKEEITRKLLHLFALLMPAGIFYLPHEKMPELMGGMTIPYSVPVLILAFLFVGSVAVELLRFRFRSVQKVFYVMFGHMLRREETVRITGSTYVIGAALACSLIFAGRPYISFMALSMFILGDAIAAIVGLSIGRIKIGKKSLEGSAACFILCMVMFCAAFPHLPWLLEAWGDYSTLHFVLIAAAASLTVTVFELVPLKIKGDLVINDNLAVPVIASGVILLMEKLLIVGIN